MGWSSSGVRKLSQIVIDSDKDWRFKEIINVGSIAKDSQKGDLIFVWESAEGKKVLKRLPMPPEKGKVLVSGGTGNMPFWDWVWETPGAKSSLERTWNLIPYENFGGVETMSVKSSIVKEAQSNAEVGTNYGPNQDDFKDESGVPSTDSEITSVSVSDSVSRESQVSLELTYSVS